MSQPDYLAELEAISDKVPLVVLADVNNRINDWILSGGKATDNYVKQKVDYAKMWAEKGAKDSEQI
ncbi:DUF6877 family protein [Listeria rustica]|uniref:DUF6877 domain-containing protein n=1 Tax=Listeria rustica TaxID=2713503 RepID=A0A7W1T6U4_9LIST|nr:DUF6877 family protein [Listeria rustica]MBA3926570.1 hypothetical protein [Listeria rustica]